MKELSVSVDYVYSPLFSIHSFSLWAYFSDLSIFYWDLLQCAIISNLDGLSHEIGWAFVNTNAIQ